MRCRESPGAHIAPKGRWNTACYLLPEDVACRKDLRVDTKILYAVYLRYSKMDRGRCEASRSMLAFRAGMYPTEISRRLGLLVDAGLVEACPRLQASTLVSIRIEGDCAAPADRAPTSKKGRRR